MASAAYSINDFLGVTGRTQHGSLALARSIESGLPVAVLDRLAERMAPGDTGFRYRIVPKATLERRRRKQQPLSSEEGNRLARVSKVYEAAWALFQDDDKVRAFLTGPHQMLEGDTPLDVALATSPGADVVVNIIGRAAHGSAV